MSRVVHCKREPYDVYIGRPSKWGNPFTHQNTARRASFFVQSRKQAIIEYENWLKAQPRLMKELRELRGKILGCWCAPKPCHGDILSRLANSDE